MLSSSIEYRIPPGMLIEDCIGRVRLLSSREQIQWSSPRPISTAKLSTLLRLHLLPINQVIYLGPYPRPKAG